MRRAPLVLVATAAGLAGVLSFHTRKLTSSVAAGPPPTTTVPPSSTGASGSPPPTTAPPAGGTRSAQGSMVQYGYGELAVKVTVSGKKITDVSVARLATAESYSQEIAVQVVPMLRQEVLSAQTANVQTISGATYTSEAYARSVQSALDQLHV